MIIFWIILVFIVGLFVVPLVFLALLKYYGWLSDAVFSKRKAKLQCLQGGCFADAKYPENFCEAHTFNPERKTR
jgi:hypothetical protein